MDIEQLKQENDALKKQVEELTQRLNNLAREDFLSSLMGRNSLSQAEFRENCRAYRVHLESDRFLVMAITLNSDLAGLLGTDAPMDQEGLRYVRFLVRNVLEDLMGESNICHVLLVQGRLCALVNLLEPDEAALESVRAAAQHTADLFEKHYDTLVNFSISRIYRDYTSLPQAYQDTQALLQYRAMAGDDSKVLEYDQRTERFLPKTRVEHFAFERSLGNYIHAGDYEAARSLVHTMLEAEFNHAKPTVQVYMIRAYGIINDILHVFDSLEEEFSPEFLVELQAGPRIVSAGSMQEVVQELDSIFDAIISRKQQAEPEPAWVQKAVDYMDAAFTDQNLNVAGVAEAVGINPVYLSRMLKKYRNIKPLEYIHQKRIDLAKTLLSQGCTVKDTLPKVGYSSALTMNRAFRKFENTTPGTFYREP
jgi:AraC-like DNA-binding protein/cell division septum initiation protein DivIVA